MKPFKAFISHRGSQKAVYVDEMLSYLPDKNKLIVDQLNFKNGEATNDEINTWMEQAGIFVAMISDDYPGQSRPTRRELKLAKDRAEADDIRVLPIICQRGLDYNNISNDLRWITGDRLSITVRPYMAPRMAAEKIKSALHELEMQIRDEHHILKYIGRERQNQTVYGRLLDTSFGSPVNALMASGKKGIGRNAFLRHCNKHYGLNGDVLPFTIDQGAGLLEFATKLHSALHSVGETLDELTFKTEQELLDIAARYIKTLNSLQWVILVKDDHALSTRKGIAPWLINLLRHQAVAGKLGILISTRYTPRESELEKSPSLIHVRLEQFPLSERQLLLKMFCAIYCRPDKMSDLDDASLRNLAADLVDGPEQLLKAAKKIAQMGIKQFIKSLDNFKMETVGSVKTLLERFNDQLAAKKLLALLALVSPLSIDLIKETLGPEVASQELDEILSELAADGVVDYEGIGYGYVALDEAVSDYIGRIDYYDAGALVKRLDDIIIRDAETDRFESDHSAWLRMKDREVIDAVPGSAGMRLGSRVLANVMRLYDRGDYNQVIRLGKEAMLNDTHYTAQTIYDIQYKICQSHIRLSASTRLDETTRSEHRAIADTLLNGVIKGVDRDFLKGFSLRLTNDPAKQSDAIKHLKRALEDDHTRNVAARELVEAYFILHDYPKALEYAKQNFDRNKDNAYHIYAYFKALLNSPQEPDREQTMADLTDRMAHSDFKKSGEFLREMQCKKPRP